MRVQDIEMWGAGVGAHEQQKRQGVLKIRHCDTVAQLWVYTGTKWSWPGTLWPS